MPAETTLGVGWQANPNLLVAADLKYVGWSDVMDSFRMRYDSAGMGGSVSFALPQHWKNQTVVQVGASQRLSPEWVVRAGVNVADNPVPDAYVNPLFPAIVKSHVMLGAGYTLSQAGEINASLAYAPSVTANRPDGVIISHRQLNMQLMYSHHF